MSEANFVAEPFDPFDPTALDEESELRALENAIRHSEGYSLLLIRCNDPSQQREILNRLKQALPEKRIEHVELREPISSLLRELRSRFDDETPEAIYVTGLEYSLPNSQNAAREPVIANLNASRNSFGRHFRCPVILCVPEYAIAAMMEGAPDFYSVRSGLYFFVRSMAQTEEQSLSLVSGTGWQTQSMDPAERQARVVEIENLIQDIRNSPRELSSYNTEYVLLFRLGLLYDSLEQWDRAVDALLQALELVKKYGTNENTAATLNNLAMVYRAQGKFRLAEDAAAASLDLIKGLDDLELESRILSNLGVIHHSQGKLKEASGELWKSGNIAMQLRDEVGAARALNNIAVIEKELGNLAQAEKAYNTCLNISRRSLDRISEGRILNNLGSLYLEQGRVVEAERSFYDSLKVTQEIGDRVTAGQILNNIGILYASQERTQEAKKAYLQSLEIKRQIKDYLGITATLGNLAWYTAIVEADYSQAMSLAQEAFSAAQQTERADLIERVNELIELIEGRTTDI